MKRLSFVLAVLMLTGCSIFGSREGNISGDAEKSIADAEWRTKESRTLSALAKLEEALTAYVKTERAIPEKVEQLIPKYLAEIPTVELHIGDHRDAARVEPYERRILRDGQIDGSQLKDTGRWGYVFSDEQVVIFVDCTHQSRRNKPWYQERGL